MLFERKQSLFIGRFPGLLSRRKLIHGISTRSSGCSPGPFDSLNLGYNTEDDSENVRLNRNRFFSAADIDESRTANPVQVHLDKIAVVKKPGLYQDTDGLITNVQGLVLTIQTADCVPVILFDEDKNAAGLIHAGWKGSALNIVRKAVSSLTDNYGCRPEKLGAFIGPSIGPCCYEIGEEALNSFDPVYIQHNHLDLWKFNTDQLLECGIKTSNVSVCKICTFCHSYLFFSHRKSGGRTGRMLTFLGIT